MSIYKIRVRRDTSGQWAFVNPVLGIGEVGFETNTRKLKVGDGTTPWNSLNYVAYEVSAHTQDISTINGLQTALDGKAALSHGHPISEVVNLQDSLDGKAPLSHSHAFIDITGLQAALDNKSNVGHGHSISDVSTLQAALDLKAAFDHTHSHEEVTATGFGREVIFNTSGLFDASPEFQYDRTTAHLIVAGTIESSGTMIAREFYGDLLGAVHAHVKNTSGGAIGKGVPVYITGTVGSTTTLEVAIARADDPSKMPAVGILVQELSSNATGHVSVLGTTPNIDTSSFSVGQTVYVGPTGGLVNSRPTGTSILVQNIGKVGRVNSNNGEIIVTGPGRTNDVPNNLGLDSLYDVESSGASSGQALLYNGSIWTYGTVVGGGGSGSPGGSSTQVQFNDDGSFGGDSGLTYNKTTDSLTIAGDLAVNGGDITTSASSFNLVNSTASTLNIGGASNYITAGAASTGTTSLRNQYLTIGASTGYIKTNVGSTNHLLLAPYGNLYLSPTSNILAGGDLPSITITNTDQAAGQVQVLGGDLYLGSKTDESATETPCNIIFEGLADGNELTLTVATLTDDRTVTLPNANGTLGLVPGSDTQVVFNDGGSLGGDGGFVYNKTTDSLTISGDIAVNGSDITTTSTGIATVFSSNALNASAFLAASGISVGSSVGTLFVNNVQTALSGELSLGTPRITTSSTGTAFLFNANATTLNLGGAATTVTVGATASTTATIRGGTIVGNTASQNVFNSTATVLNAFGAATGLTIGSATGLAHIRNPNLRLGNTTASILTNSGDSNSLTIQPFGNVLISPTKTTLVGGDIPSLVITNSDDAAGQIQITGGDLYLGSKNNAAETETPCNIIFEGTIDANELTLTVASLTADRTVTLPDLTGTVALVAGASGQIQFNNGYTALGGSSNLSFDGSNLTIGSQGDIRLSDSDSSNYVGFQSPATVSSNTIWTLPSGDGSGAQSLFTNGSGLLYWSSPGGGGISRSISNVSGTTNAGSSANTDYVYNAVSDSFTITLPTAVSNTNRYTMKQSSTGVLTIATTSSQTIDGSTTYSLSKQYQAVDILSNGSNWFLV